MSLKIVIVCNKKDFFLTKILIGSIRFYYPQVEIFIIKDYLNGTFDTTQAEIFLNVRIMDLGIKKYGWSAAKMHFLFAEEFKNEKFLVLDSDIVLVGKLLDKLGEQSKSFDIAVSTHPSNNPNDDFAIQNYYSYPFIKTYNPSFEFPGYFFNGGQMVVTPGIIKQHEVIDFFDLSKFPYWKRLDVLPFVDQSLLNFILPLKEQKGEIKIFKGDFMIWSESENAKTLELSEIKKGDKYPYLIHWAGATRLPMLNRMTRPDILSFFESYYYSKVPYGTLKRKTSKFLPIIDFNTKKLFRTFVKPVVKRLRKS